jgi:uncharacterized protein
MMQTAQQIIDKYYQASSTETAALRELFMHHAQQVADEACLIAARKHLPLDIDEVRSAALLHDIGIYLTDAPGIHCHGSEPYLNHGPLGAALLRREGAPEAWARVAERHTGAGIGEMVPETLLERLVCYADKFYSKSGDMKKKSLERVEASMLRFGEENLQKFHRLHSEFGQDAD